MFFKTLISMENEEAASLAEATVPVEVAEATADDRRMIEADVASDDVEAVTRALSSLDGVVDVVSYAQDNGGMDQTTAAAVSVGLEHIYQSIGAHRNHINLSLESFKEDPKKSTQLVLESIADRAAAIWNGLIEMIKRFVRWISDFFGDLTSSVESLARRAEKSSALIRVIKGKPSSQVIEDEALCRRLFSKDIPASKLVSGFRDMGESVFAAQFGMNNFAEGEVSSLFNLISSTADTRRKTTSSQDLEGLKKKTMTLVKKVGTELFSGMSGAQEGVPEAPQSVDVFSTPSMLGGKGYFAFVPKDWEHIDELKLGIYSGEEGSYDSIPTLTTDEMKQVAATVISMRRVKELNKKTLTNLKVAEIFLNQIASTLGKGRAHGGVAAYGSDFARVREQSARAVLKLLTSKGMTGFGHYVSVGRDMLRLMEMSMKLHPEVKMSESRELVAA